MSQTKAQLIEGLNINTSAPADALVIDSSGNVGIGQSSPVVALQVSGTSAARIQLSTDNTGHTASDGSRIQVDSSNNLELLQRESANIEFFTAGTERMRIDSSGRLLLGTTTEGYSSGDDLTIATSGHTGITLRSGTTSEGAIYFSDATSGGGEYIGSLVYSHNTNNMLFSANGAERMRIDSAGRLLHGTSSSSAAASAIFEGNSSNAAGAGVIYLNRGTGSMSAGLEMGFIRFGDQDENTGALIEAEADGTWASNDYPGRILFSTTADGGSSPTERLRINSSGNVGIGTTSPLRALTIAKTGSAISGTGNSFGFSINPLTNGYVYLDAVNSGSNNTSLSLRTYNNGTYTQALQSISGNETTFETAGTERMRIDSSGRLGIGLASNITSLFHVESSYAGTIAEIKNTRGSASTDAGLLIETSTTAAKTLSVKNAGIERFYVQGNGTVFVNDSLGIGTTSPGEELVVRANAPSVQLESSNASGRSYGMQSDSNGKFHVAYDATAGANRITLSSSGNVGINQTAPARALEVRDASSTVNSIISVRTQATSSTTNGFAQLEFKHGTATSAFIWHNAGNTTSYAGANSLNFYNGHAADYAFFTNGNNERVRIRNGGGITFNGDTAAGNALDDYEEGTWTPVPNFGGGTTGITYATAPTGNYTKIGNLVFVVMGFQFSNKGSSTGSFVVSGLPYSVASTGSFKHPNSVVNAHNMTNNNKIYAALGAGSAINYRRISDSNTDAVPGDGDFQNNSGFYHSMVYVT